MALKEGFLKSYQELTDCLPSQVISRCPMGRIYEAHTTTTDPKDSVMCRGQGRYIERAIMSRQALEKRYSVQQSKSYTSAH